MTRTLLLGLSVGIATWLSSQPARASCNLVAAPERTFPSTLGEVSTPFARPGDPVTLSRSDVAFSSDPAANDVTLAFQPAQGTPTVLSVPALAPGSTPRCAPSDCFGGLCRCVSFHFPGTDSQVGGPADGLGLAGPVVITVTTGGQPTAQIDALLIPGSPFRDDVFPSFVALPPATAVDALTSGSGGDVLGAADDQGNLFLPLGFGSLVPHAATRTRFLTATVPALGSFGDAPIDSFTTDGLRLPPLVRRVAGVEILGTADAPESVLRIEAGAQLAGIAPVEGKGPIVIPNVSADADPNKRADGITLTVGERFAVFENRECGFFDALEECADVNGDGDQTDHFLVALDLASPAADPITIDEVDVSELPGFPFEIPPFALYAFSASDELVGFRIPETLIFDINGNGSRGDLIRSGAFDLVRGAAIRLADGSPRLELDQGLLAFTVTDAHSRDVLHVYDASLANPRPSRVRGPRDPQFFVTRFPVGAVPFSTVPFDLAVRDGRVAFAVREATQGRDLTRDKLLLDDALLLFDPARGGVSNLVQPILAGLLTTSPRFLAFQALGSTGTSVGLRELSRPRKPPRFACDELLALGYLASSLSDTLVPCTKNEAGIRDLNGDGDTDDFRVLHAFLPDVRVAPEVNLGLALFTQFDPHVRNDTLVVAVDETAQGTDLDGDGLVGNGGPFGPFVLHAFHGPTRTLINFEHDVAVSSEPFLQFTETGLTFISSAIVRTLFRDLDQDGHFEELFTDPATGKKRIADNCPRDANPLQQDSDADGIGDACDVDAI